VHRSYARKAQVVIPTLEDFEKRMPVTPVIVPFAAAVV
jgi:hypothetical protein